MSETMAKTSVCVLQKPDGRIEVIADQPVSLAFIDEAALQRRAAESDDPDGVVEDFRRDTRFHDAETITGGTMAMYRQDLVEELIERHLPLRRFRVDVTREVLMLQSATITVEARTSAQAEELAHEQVMAGEHNHADWQGDETLETRQVDIHHAAPARR